MMMEMMPLKTGLNQQQQDAVEHRDGPLLIIAGAGTGKTRVITHRIAYLMSHCGASPYNILSLTFTNKAALEMKERAISIVGDVAQGVMLCTFHSFCNYVLRRDIGFLDGYRQGFSIYDEDDSKSCIKSILKQMELPSSAQFSPAKIYSIFSKAKNFGVPPDEYISHNDRLQDYVSELFDRYVKLLHHNNALDFDDLLLKTVQLFEENRDVLNKYKSRFTHILVDEYQDTNTPQYDLLKLLACPDGNITVVGDLDQSIYGWRGANAGNMFSFETDFKNVKIVALEQNYRSFQVILNAANSLIANNPGLREKHLWSELGEGEGLVLLTPWDDREEAQLIASEIDSLMGDGYRLNDIAVMFRTRAQSRVFEEVFIRNNLPHRLIGATAFYHRKEIKDMIAYLRVLENPSDFASFERIANVPKRGIGGKTIEAIRSLSDEKGNVLELIDDGGKSVAGLPTKAVKIIQLLKKLRKEKESTGVSDLIKMILEGAGYYEYLDQLELQEGTASRRENVEELVSLAVEFAHDTLEPTLDGFLSRVTLMSDLIDKDTGEDRVQVLTLHVAKGLEFPVVFISGVEEGLLPHMTSIEEKDGVQEERRLCYVGITRAKKRLYLSCCRSRMRFGTVANNAPSRFISEIGEEYFQLRDDSRAIAREDSFFFEDGERDKFVTHEVDDYCEIDESAISGRRYKKGDYVIHQYFGKGCVIEISDDDIGISFPGQGVKYFDLSYAPIKKA